MIRSIGVLLALMEGMTGLLVVSAVFLKKHKSMDSDLWQGLLDPLQSMEYKSGIPMFGNIEVSGQSMLQTKKSSMLQKKSSRSMIEKYLTGVTIAKEYTNTRNPDPGPATSMTEFDPVSDDERAQVEAEPPPGREISVQVEEIDLGNLPTPLSSYLEACTEPAHLNGRTQQIADAMRKANLGGLRATKIDPVFFDKPDTEAECFVIKSLKDNMESGIVIVINTLGHVIAAKEPYGSSYIVESMALKNYVRREASKIRKVVQERGEKKSTTTLMRFNGVRNRQTFAIDFSKQKPFKRPFPFLQSDSGSLGNQEGSIRMSQIEVYYLYAPMFFPDPCTRCGLFVDKLTGIVRGSGISRTDPNVWEIYNQEGAITGNGGGSQGNELRQYAFESTMAFAIHEAVMNFRDETNAAITRAGTTARTPEIVHKSLEAAVNSQNGAPQMGQLKGDVIPYPNTDTIEIDFAGEILVPDPNQFSEMTACGLSAPGYYYRYFDPKSRRVYYIRQGNTIEMNQGKPFVVDCYEKTTPTGVTKVSDPLADRGKIGVLELLKPLPSEFRSHIVNVRGAMGKLTKKAFSDVKYEVTQDGVLMLLKNINTPKESVDMGRVMSSMMLETSTSSSLQVAQESEKKTEMGSDKNPTKKNGIYERGKFLPEWKPHPADRSFLEEGSIIGGGQQTTVVVYVGLLAKDSYGILSEQRQTVWLSKDLIDTSLKYQGGWDPACIDENLKFVPPTFASSPEESGTSEKALASVKQPFAFDDGLINTPSPLRAHKVELVYVNKHRDILTTARYRHGSSEVIEHIDQSTEKWLGRLTPTGLGGFAGFLYKMEVTAPIMEFYTFYTMFIRRSSAVKETLDTIRSMTEEIVLETLKAGSANYVGSDGQEEVEQEMKESYEKNRHLDSKGVKNMEDRHAEQFQKYTHRLGLFLLMIIMTCRWLDCFLGNINNLGNMYCGNSYRRCLTKYGCQNCMLSCRNFNWVYTEWILKMGGPLPISDKDLEEGTACASALSYQYNTCFLSQSVFVYLVSYYWFHFYWENEKDGTSKAWAYQSDKNYKNSHPDAKQTQTADNRAKFYSDKTRNEVTDRGITAIFAGYMLIDFWKASFFLYCCGSRSWCYSKMRTEWVDMFCPCCFSGNCIPESMLKSARSASSSSRVRDQLALNALSKGTQYTLHYVFVVVLFWLGTQVILPALKSDHFEDEDDSVKLKVRRFLNSGDDVDTFWSEYHWLFIPCFMILAVIYKQRKVEILCISIGLLLSSLSIYNTILQAFDKKITSTTLSFVIWAITSALVVYVGIDCQNTERMVAWIPIWAILAEYGVGRFILKPFASIKCCCCKPFSCFTKPNCLSITTLGCVNCSLFLGVITFLTPRHMRCAKLLQIAFWAYENPQKARNNIVAVMVFLLACIFLGPRLPHMLYYQWRSVDWFLVFPVTCLCIFGIWRYCKGRCGCERIGCGCEKDCCGGNASKDAKGCRERLCSCCCTKCSGGKR